VLVSTNSGRSANSRCACGSVAGACHPGRRGLIVRAPVILARRHAIAPTTDGDPGGRGIDHHAACGRVGDIVGSAGDSRRTSLERTSSYRPSVMRTGDPSAEMASVPTVGVVVPGRGSATFLIVAQTVDSQAGESARVKEAVTPPGSRATGSAYASSAALCSRPIHRNHH